MSWFIRYQILASLFVLGAYAGIVHYALSPEIVHNAPELPSALLVLTAAVVFLLLGFLMRFLIPRLLTEEFRMLLLLGAFSIFVVQLTTTNHWIISSLSLLFIGTIVSYEAAKSHYGISEDAIMLRVSFMEKAYMLLMLQTALLGFIAQDVAERV